MDIGGVCNRRVPMAAVGTSVLAAAKSMQMLDEPVLVLSPAPA